MTRHPDDYQQRLRALDTASSFICEAPAGSGKTELLTQRFLKLLARVNRPEQVLAITFTRKAANEMRERILRALEMSEKPIDGHHQLTWSLAQDVKSIDAQQDWHLVKNPTRLQVRTFDSLCAYLAAALPVHSEFGAVPEVSDDSEHLYLEAVRQFLLTLEEDVPWRGALEEMLLQLDNNFSRLEQLLMAMLSRREAWLPIIPATQTPMTQTQSEQAIRQVLEHHLQHVRDETVAKVRSLIPLELQRELIALAGFAAANVIAENLRNAIGNCVDIDMQGSVLPDASELGIRQWFGLLMLLTTNAGEWRKGLKSLNRRQGFPRGETATQREFFREKKQQLTDLINELKNIDGLLDAINDIRLVPAVHYDLEQWEMLKALTQVLPVVAAHLTLVFAQKNKVDFLEISGRAQSALGKLDAPSALALKLDYQLQHILVDEFQDTSLNQVSLLRQLTAGWQPDDGRTLFCVGDAMQSIYGFRGANVGLFLHAQQMGLGDINLETLRLTTNFRSQAGVVEWVNHVFTSAFPNRADIANGAVTYSASTAFKEKQSGRAVWTHAFVKRDDRSRDQDEARIVLGVVRKAIQDDPDSSIAILVRNRLHAAHIVPMLHQANIAFRAVELEPLADNVVIQDLLSLSQALLHPADRTSWLAILRAPWCGLSLVDLETLANFDMQERRHPILIEQLRRCLELQIQDNPVESNNTQVDMFTTTPLKQAPKGERSYQRLLTPDGLDRLTRVVPVLQRALEQRQRKTLRQWIEGTWIQLGGASCIQDQSELDNVKIFFELLEKFDTGSDVEEIDTLSSAVKKLFSAPNSASNGQIQVMTMHKSKGLEFDTVLLPALHRGAGRNDSELLLWHNRLTANGHEELLLAPIPASNRDKSSERIYRHLKEMQKKKSRLESTRLLYVACTRARKNLHLFAEVRRAKNDAVRLLSPRKTSLLANIWQSLQTTKIKYYESAVVAEDSSAVVEKPKFLQRLKPEWRLPALQYQHLLDAHVPAFEFDNSETEDLSASLNSIPRHVGTLVHQILQDMCDYGVARWSETHIEKNKSFWRARLMTLGVSSTEVSEAAGQVEKIVAMIKTDKNIQWMFDSRHPEKKREFPLTLKSKSGFVQLVVDLLIQKDDGETWIIDFKTSQPEGGQTLETFIELEKQRYMASLDQYHHAVVALGYRNVKSALYFPLIQEFAVL